jgi:uncharacterized coiled-coil protein SlyX
MSDLEARLAGLERRMYAQEREIAALTVLALTAQQALRPLSNAQWREVWEGSLAIVHRRWPHLPHEEVHEAFLSLIRPLALE